MKIPGFTAERSLFASGSLHVRPGGGEGGNAIIPAPAGNFGGAGVMMQAGPIPNFGSAPGRPAPAAVAAESVPGGPSTVPSGYGRTCKRVPYWVCDANGCRTEYGWVCTYYPLPRMM